VKPKKKKKVAKKKAAKVEAVASAINTPWSGYPSFDEGTADRLNSLAQRYAEIVRNGGFPAIPAKGKLGPGADGEAVQALRARLVMEGDLASEGSAWDDEVTKALRRWQMRYGIPANGQLTPRTRAAMAISAEKRLRQIGSNMERLASRFFEIKRRNVIVNIPNAQVEAVIDGRVDRRYIAIVGRPENPSPEIDARIGAVNLNPTWTVPASIIEKELAPKMLKDPSTLKRMRIRVLNAKGKEIPASAVDWSSKSATNYILRQDSGIGNSLGQIRISMPNPEAVYMHDTPSKKLFSATDRFFSHGCVRVQNVNDLAAWLIGDGWDAKRVASKIAEGEREDVPLPDIVPVHWMYMTAYVTADGTAHFRDDVYGLDFGGGVVASSQ
jgi:L,D-transpeptidase YcbB